MYYTQSTFPVCIPISTHHHRRHPEITATKIFSLTSHPTHGHRLNPLPQSDAPFMFQISLEYLVDIKRWLAFVPPHTHMKRNALDNPLALAISQTEYWRTFRQTYHSRALLRGHLLFCIGFECFLYQSLLLDKRTARTWCDVSLQAFMAGAYTPTRIHKIQLDDEAISRPYSYYGH